MPEALCTAASHLAMHLRGKWCRVEAVRGAVRCDAVHGMACMLYGVLPPIERDIADGRWGLADGR